METGCLGVSSASKKMDVFLRRVTFHVSEPLVFRAGLENEPLEVCYTLSLTTHDPSLNLRRHRQSFFVMLSLIRL